MNYEVWNEGSKLGDVLANNIDQAKVLAAHKFPVHGSTMTVAPGAPCAVEPPQVVAEARPPSAAQTFSKWYADKAQEAEANRQLGERIFDALAALDVSSVLVAFDGAGDDGQVIQLSLRQRDKTPPPDAADIPFEGHTLYEAIEQFIYNRLSADHGSWEIDTGSFGKFFLYVEHREVREQFTARIEDEDEYEDESSPQVYL
jgi:hypothetical protein